MNGRDCIFNYQALILDFHHSRAKKPPLVEISRGRSRSGVKGLRALPPGQLPGSASANPFHPASPDFLHVHS